MSKIVRHRAIAGAPSLCWGLAITILFFVLCWSPKAAAQSCTGPAGDCDGDGTPDSQETCPGGGAKTEYREGFCPIGCFDGLLAQGYASGKLNNDSFGWDVCVPVAARRIQETIPNDHLRPASVTGRTHVNGVVFVGVLNPATTGSASTLTSLHPASPQSVIAGFESGKVPRTSLFTCVGSIQFADDGTLTKDPLWVYGYHFSASYVRAILEAGRAAGPKQFMDGVGLIREIRENKPGWANGVAGTNGTLWDRSHWSTKPEVLQDKNIQTGDLPTYVDHFVDGTCYADLTDKLFGKFKDGMDVSPYPPLFLTLPDPAPDSYREWNGALTEKEFKDSADGKAALNRLSSFGLRPIQPRFRSAPPGEEKRSGPVQTSL